MCPGSSEMSFVGWIVFFGGTRRASTPLNALGAGVIQRTLSLQHVGTVDHPKQVRSTVFEAPALSARATSLVDLG
jgi:hypothetical protein